MQYPTGLNGGTAVEFVINPANFHDAFAADLSPKEAALMAATQRPVAESAFSDASGKPAWKKLPSWAVVATGDKAAGADVIRSMAKRAGAVDHRGRGVPRHHDVATPDRGGCHLEGDSRGRLTLTRSLAAT